MKILVLDEEFPYPFNTGKRIRSYHLIQQLAAQHEIFYLAYGRAESESYLHLEKSRIHPIPVRGHIPKKSGLLFYLRLGANLFSRLPYIVTSHHSRAYTSAVRNAVASIRPDRILCEWTPYAVFLQDVGGARTVIVAHNIESAIWRRYAEHEKSGLKKWYIGRQAAKVTHFEQTVFRAADGITAVTDTDARQITALAAGTPVCVVENGVDLAYFAPENSATRGQRLVFTGSMDWRPNQDAAEFFIKEIFPLLRPRYPGLKVFFVGRNPPLHTRELSNTPGVTVTGTVEDVRPFIRDAAVYIVPLRIGGGSRLKILEALAMGKAVVSTSVGAEGLAITDGQEFLLADTPEEFARQVAYVLDHENIGRRLGEAGRRLVEGRYGWDMIAERLEQFVVKLVSR